MFHHTMKFIHLWKNYIDLPGYILVVQGENAVPPKKNRPGKEKQHTPEGMLEQQKSEHLKSEARKRWKFMILGIEKSVLPKKILWVINGIYVSM